MTLLRKLTVGLFALLAVLEIAETYSGGWIIRLMLVLTKLIITLPLTCWYIAGIFGSFLKKEKFDYWEYLTLASVASFIVLPLLLITEFTVLRQTYVWLPLANALIIAIVGELFIKNMTWPLLSPLPAVSFRLLPLLKQPLTWAALCYGGIVAMVFSAYFSLPELDPYYWLGQYAFQFNDNVFSSWVDRPLFYAFSFIFVHGARVDLYAYFKYVLPALSILSLLPAYLVARQYTSRLQQLAILAIPTFVPSTLLYAQVPFPQAIFTVLTYYYFFWLIYGVQHKRSVFYYLAGFIAFVSYFYHQIGAILFCLWLLSELLFSHRKLLRLARANKVSVGLMLIILITNSSWLAHPFVFISNWLQRIAHQVALNPNWRFPSYYTNIDGNAVGWSGGIGVIKYYLFYAGPVVTLLILFFVYLLISRTKIRLAVLESLKHRASLTLWLSLALFLSISEIMPRLFSIAMLPERSWLFVGIFASASLILLFEALSSREKNILAGVVIAGCLISIAGAVYINNLKKYVIPEYQLRSAEWIQEFLPAERTIISSGNDNLLLYHAQSRVLKAPSTLYCDMKFADPDVLLRETRPATIVRDPAYTFIAEQALDELRLYLSGAPTVTIEDIGIVVAPYVEPLNVALNQSRQLPANEKVYVYYYQPDSRNPYIGRPYIELAHDCEEKVFDAYPDKYQRVYEDRDQVIIWQVK